MKYLLFIGILVYMFLSTTVAAKIGIIQVGTFSSFLIVFLFFIKFSADLEYKLFYKYGEEFRIIVLGLFLIFVKVFLSQFEQINQVLFFAIVPMILSVLLGTQNRTTKEMIKNLILFFFIAECFLAIYERFNLINVFPYIKEIEETDIENWSFRSTGFLGHPLSNALCVSTIMGFVLITPMKLAIKLFYLILGFVSLLCFNARAAILVWILLATIYLINLIRDKRTKTTVSFLLFIFFIAAIYFVYMMMVDFGFGGRIVNDKINDGSAQSRIQVLDAFNYIDNSDLWFGNAANYIPVMKKLGAGGVENSYIVLILNYGIGSFIVLLLLYYKLIRRFLKNYSRYFKFIILCSFLIVGSANNALAGSMPWGFLILCFYSFPPIRQGQIGNKFNVKERMKLKNKKRMLINSLLNTAIKTNL